MPGPTALPIGQEHMVIWGWIGLQIAGQATLLVLLLTYLFSRRLVSQRHPFVINFVTTWLLSTIVALLLLYTGQQEQPSVSRYVCLFNAALIAGVPPMEAVAFFAVMVQVWNMLRSVVDARTAKQRPIVTVLMLASPYVAFIGFSVAAGALGFNNPSSVTRLDHLVYCSVSNNMLGISIWAFTGVVVLLTLLLQAWIIISLYRHRRAVRGVKVSRLDVDIHLVFRAAAFALYEIAIVAISVLSIWSKDIIVPELMQACAPLSVFFILASQPDVFLSWVFCCRARREDTAPPTPQMSSRSLDGHERRVTLLEALEECTFPDAVPTAASAGTSNYDATRATFSPRSRASPSRGIVYSPDVPRRHVRGPSASTIASAPSVLTITPVPSARGAVSFAIDDASSAASHSWRGPRVLGAGAGAASSWGSDRGLLAHDVFDDGRSSVSSAYSDAAGESSVRPARLHPARTTGGLPSSPRLSALDVRIDGAGGRRPPRVGGARPPGPYAAFDSGGHGFI